MRRPIWSLLHKLNRPTDPSSDAAVLQRFAQMQEETAFELLVWRHGGLVQGVCQRMLRDEHLAEDAFQATFLILARKAGTVRGSLAAWLHRVARHVCLRARQKHPVPVELKTEPIAGTSADEVLACELQLELDGAIGCLADKHRQVIVLCYLQNRTTDDAALVLGIPRGTVLSRLATARKQLQKLLTRRGMIFPATLITGGAFTPDLTAEVCRRITTTAMAFLHSPIIPTISTQLALEVLGMATRKMILGTTLVLVLSVGLSTGVGLVIAQNGGKTMEMGTPTNPLAREAPKPPKTDAEKHEEALKRIALKRTQRLEELAQLVNELNDEIAFCSSESLKSIDESTRIPLLKLEMEDVQEEIRRIESRDTKPDAEVKIQKLKEHREMLFIAYERLQTEVKKRSVRLDLYDDRIQILRDIRKKVLRESLLLQYQIDDVK
jgi:RNA polymerase sigma factor (sigma-70 family)